MMMELREHDAMDERLRRERYVGRRAGGLEAVKTGVISGAGHSGICSQHLSENC